MQYKIYCTGGAFESKASHDTYKYMFFQSHLGVNWLMCVCMCVVFLFSTAPVVISSIGTEMRVEYCWDVRVVLWCFILYTLCGCFVTLSLSQVLYDHSSERTLKTKAFLYRKCVQYSSSHSLTLSLHTVYNLIHPVASCWFLGCCMWQQRRASVLWPGTHSSFHPCSKWRHTTNSTAWTQQLLYVRMTITTSFSFSSSSSSSSIFTVLILNISFHAHVRTHTHTHTHTHIHTHSGLQ